MHNNQFGWDPNSKARNSLPKTRTARLIEGGGGLAFVSWGRNRKPEMGVKIEGGDYHILPTDLQSMSEMASGGRKIFVMQNLKQKTPQKMRGFFAPQTCMSTLCLNRRFFWNAYIILN